MTIHRLNNLFSYQELAELKTIISKENDKIIDNKLGRIMLTKFDISDDIKIKLINLVNSLWNDMGNSNKLELSGITYVEYSNKYGTPNLPPHFDGDSTDIIIDFQLESNTSWDLGADLEVYSVEDNAAILLNPNKYIHWRPHKIFKDGEYIQMIFFRFCDPFNLSDYSDLRLSLNDDIFKSVNSFRDSIKYN